MTSTGVLNAIAIAAVLTGVAAIAARNVQRDAPIELLNVSYDPTRELYQAVNRDREAASEASGTRLHVTQSHGGSSRQAVAVAEGRERADVVTLALPSDIELMHRRGLIADGWAGRLPNQSRPYYSTIVFVVRRGNPLHILDWPDLIKPGVEVITPDPRSSGNGKLSALAAWGAALARGATDAEARAYLRALYEHAPFLELAARSAAEAFAIERLGDVHLTWENEALREVGEASGGLEIVYPSTSILAEPAVAWVDANVSGVRLAAAQAYLGFLFGDAGQELIAANGYRPYKLEILKRHDRQCPDLELFPISAIARDWDDAQDRFFGDGGILEAVYRPKPRS